MRTWFITGCSTGFGRRLAEAVLARGDRAAVTARTPAQVSEIVDGAGERALALRLDVTSHDEIMAAVTRAEETFDGIDVLVNNAGIGYFAAVEESDEAEVRRMFEINVFGLANLTRAVLPGMRARRRGMIVNMSSIGGLKAFPALAYYNATKFAVEGLSEGLWQELEPLGVRVMVVEPSGFRTDWAGRSAKETSPGTEIADYAETAGEMRRVLREVSGKQPGDPERGARAIIDAVESDNPPRRLLLGTAAYDEAHAKLDELRAGYRAWEAVSRSVDFPAAAEARGDSEPS